jgi:hypothetical protein
MILPFRAGSHGWEVVAGIFQPYFPISKLDLRLEFSSFQGQVWFDQVRVSQFPECKRFHFKKIHSCTPG